MRHAAKSRDTEVPLALERHSANLARGRGQGVRREAGSKGIEENHGRVDQLEQSATMNRGGPHRRSMVECPHYGD